jgi:hypothetical protein
MITVKLLGGLGNQMFQAAYALALESRGYAVQLDRTALIEGTHREYSLGYFNAKAEGWSNGREVYEDGMRYNPSYLEPTDGCTMIGYWQSEKYFIDIADKVRGKFKFPEISPRMPYHIAIHVRRQDYVGLQHFHGIPGINYYREGVANIRRAVGANLQVLVFSDDHSWCRENLPSNFQIVDGGNKYDDLRMMSECYYHVIANSSFSWWGAWLGGQRMVVAPKQWFSDPSVDYSDIVPESWTRI